MNWFIYYLAGVATPVIGYLLYKKFFYKAEAAVKAEVSKVVTKL